MTTRLTLEGAVVLPVGPGEAAANLRRTLGGPGPASFRLGRWPWPVAGRVDWPEPGLLEWRGRAWGLDFQRTVAVEPAAGGCRLHTREQIGGWPLWLLRPFFRPRELSRRALIWLSRAARPSAG